MTAFTAAEASRLAGFKKPWMLNHLEREDIFRRQPGSGGSHGKGRRYTFRDIIVLRAINRMLELGARPKRIAESIHCFSNIINLPKSDDELLEFANGSGAFVVTPESVVFCKNQHEMIDLLRSGQLSFSFMVDVKLTMQPVVVAIDQYIKKRSGPAANRIFQLDQIAITNGI